MPSLRRAAPQLGLGDIVQATERQILKRRRFPPQHQLGGATHRADIRARDQLLVVLGDNGQHPQSFGGQTVGEVKLT